MSWGGSRWLVLLLVLFMNLHGCSWRLQKAISRKSAETSSPTATVSSSSLISESLHTLLQQQPLKVNSELRSPYETTEIPIPTGELLANDATQYVLLINKSNGLAWVLRTGGIGNHIREVSGPWSSDSNEIARLLAAMNIDKSALVDHIDLPGPEPTNIAHSGTADSAEHRSN